MVYRERPVVFILGGDRNVETDADLELVRAMARGLEEAAPERLITYHPWHEGSTTLERAARLWPSTRAASAPWT